jgi:hypothetical protein
MVTNSIGSTETTLTITATTLISIGREEKMIST